MTISDSFWLLGRFAQSWAQGTDPAPPRIGRRKAVFTQQNIETIGGSHTPPQFDVDSTLNPLLGDPKLPAELIVHIVLLAAHDIILDAGPDVVAELLQLARVSRLCHRAILATFILPDLTLHGLQQVCAFAIALEKDRLGLRTLASVRVRSLTLRARFSRSAGAAPALFDASQAQTRFARQLLPWIRLVLQHCQALETLRIEGVPRGLFARSGKMGFDEQALRGLASFSCLTGLYGGDLERDFWLAQRWTNLTQLQLHGPRLSFTSTLALSVASLPRLKKLGLVVPMVVNPTQAVIPTGDGDGRIDVGSLNTLQDLLDHSPSLELLLLVGHGERDYVGNSERLRNWMQDLQRDRAKSKVQLRLVTVIRRTQGAQTAHPSRARVHPCEVSAWMMDRAQRGLEWFENEEQDQDSRAGLGFDYWIETWQAAEYTTPAGSNNVSNIASRVMSRTSSNTRDPAEAQVDQIEATDMLSSDDDGSLD